ncbi:OmpA family protein [Vibrio cholerae]
MNKIYGIGTASLFVMGCAQTPTAEPPQVDLQANHNEATPRVIACGKREVMVTETIESSRHTLVMHRTGQLVSAAHANGESMHIDVSSANTLVSSECYEYADSQIKEGDGPIAIVYFDFDKSTLTEASKQVLNQVYQQFKVPAPRLSIEGHTDNVGTAGYNHALGLARAETVASYLIQKGYNKEELNTVSYGFERAITPNDTPEARAKNRRVNLVTTN